MQPPLDIPVQLVPYANRTAIEGDELFYYSAGRREAPVLLLLHGLADDADTWRHLMLPLSRFFRVLAPDLPGFGRSRSGPAAPSMTSYAVRMQRWLRSMQITQFMVVGHSFGAMVAGRLAMISPAAVTRQVLISGFLPLKPELTAGSAALLLLPGAAQLMTALLRRSPAAAWRSLQPFFAGLDRLPAADQRFLQRRVQARVQQPALTVQLVRTLRWLALDTLTRSAAFSRYLRTSQTPTALIVGGEDGLISHVQLAQLRESRTDLPLHTLPDCGHTPQVEQPDVVGSLIIEHLAPRPMTLLPRRSQPVPRR